MSQFGEQKKLAKDLCISEDTFYSWKKEFGLPVKTQIKYSESEKLELIGKYYKIKQRNPKISERDIANILNIGKASLYRWKKQFVNSVNEHSLPENGSTYADNDISEHPMASSDDNLWAWNLAQKKRTEVGTLREEIKGNQIGYLD
uniref:Transposase n=1 Tax=Globodera rostochiensis TaxID=31243 RepID=A0A914HAC7_GLORO